jgi:TRAP-type C4-dicarboxylate transport system substrate-binding protein
MARSLSLRRAFACGILALAVTAPAVAQTKLKFASFEPPTAALTSKVMTPWAAEVSAASKGTLQIDMFPGGTLGRNPAQQFKLVQDGVADIAWIVLGYTPGRFDDTDVVALPFVTRNSTEASIVMTRMLQRDAFVGFADLKVLALAATPPLVIHSRAPVKSLADVKGKRVRATGDQLLKVVEAMGGVPVQMAGPAIAEGLSRGVVDMTLNNWGFVGDFKVNEVTSYHLNMPLGGVAVMIAMRKDKYEALPPQAKAAVDKASGELLARRLGAMFDEIETAYMQRIAKSGKNTVVVPTAEEVRAWQQVIEPTNDAWRKAKPRHEQLYQQFTAELQKVRAGQ